MEEKKKEAISEKSVSRRDFLAKGGKYTLMTATVLQVLLTSKRAMAQSGLAKFVVEPLVPIHGSFSGNIPATSPNATWTLGALAIYTRYRISFTGYTNQLPPNVDVMVRWDGSDPTAFKEFYWDGSTQSSGQQTFTIPKSGGTIGVGGNPYNTSQPRPDVSANTGGNSPQPITVTFTANNVEKLEINIVSTIWGP